jgi:hypothetical protein
MRALLICEAAHFDIPQSLPQATTENLPTNSVFPETRHRILIFVDRFLEEYKQCSA